MDPAEHVELAVRRTAARVNTSGSPAQQLVHDVLRMLADEIAKISRDHDLELAAVGDPREGEF
jgi:hypothetical protein